MNFPSSQLGAADGTRRPYMWVLNPATAAKGQG